MSDKNTAEIITIKKGKTKKQVDKKRIEQNNATMEDIFYQLPFTLKIGEETFEIERKSCMEAFPIQRKINNLLQSIIEEIGSDKIRQSLNDFENKTNIGASELFALVSENYSIVGNNIDDILEIFIEDFISDKDKKKLENITPEDLDKAFSDICKVIFPFFIRPIRRILNLITQLT